MAESWDLALPPNTNTNANRSSSSFGSAGLGGGPRPPVERRGSSASNNVLTRTFTKTLLHDVSLSDILSGQTCSPIGFKDFESFLAHKEFSLENLLFIVWFRSYQRRFLALPPHIQARAVRPTPLNGDRWGEGKRRAWERSRGVGVDEGVVEDLTTTATRTAEGGEGGGGGKGEDAGPGTDYKVKLGKDGEVEVRRVGFQKCAWTQEGLMCTYNPDASDSLGEDSSNSTPSKSKTNSSSSSSSNDDSDKAHELHCTNAKHHHSSSEPLHPTASCVVDDDDDGGMPFREEARRAYATFIRAGAAKELNLEDKVRERVKNQLEISTHPDCWIPAYEATYILSETASLPHFLSFAQANIQMPKRFFWYLVGFTDLAISLLIYLLTVFLLPAHPYGWRAIRLISVIFACFGSMQAYSAYRGFCTQVWGRASRQAHPWEMEDLEEDEEAAIGGDAKSKELLQPEVDESAAIGGRGDNTAKAFRDPFADASPPSAKQQHLPPPIHVSLHPNDGMPPDLSPTATEFPSDSTSTLGTDDEKKIGGGGGKEIETKNLDADKLSPLAVPPSPTTAAKKSTRPPLTPRTDLEITSFLLPSSALPVSRQPSALSLGLGTGGGPITMQISYSATNRTSNPNANLFAWGEPEEGEGVEKFKKPPIFGPEVVIEDPRIIALHKQVVMDILTVGAGWTVIWIVLCLAVPGYQR